MPKQIKKWYSRLSRTGRILLYAAGVGLAWLLFQLLNTIFGFLPELPQWARVLFIVLNVIAILLITFVVAQAAAVIYMLNEESEMIREMMTRGKRGSQMQNVAGHRNAGSMTRRGARNMQTAVGGLLTVDAVNQKYPARWYKRPTVIADWMEIEEPGLYALSEDRKQKIEIIDATEVGAGYLIGTFEGRFVQWKRKLVLNRKTGRPQTFSSLRNAKKQLSKVI